MKKKTFIIGGIFLVGSLIIGSIIYLNFYQKHFLPDQINSEIVKEKGGDRNNCLGNEELVDFKIERLGKYPSIEYNKGRVILKKIFKNQEIWQFKIEDIDPSYYHSLEIHKCGIYVIRSFELDERKGLYRKHELWRYTYDGNGIMLMSDEDFRLYSLDFRIDPNEKYLVLERGYLGHPDYALVIKNLETKEDVFVLPLKEITEKYPGSIGFNQWTKDGKYFWGNIFVGANVLAFFRIERDTFKYEIFPAPKDVLGGDALNVETGYITLHPGNVWYGDVEFEQMEKEKRRKKGIGTELYIENLITKERYFVDKTNEPLWYFQPRWLSDTELEYSLPDGKRKVFVVK